MPYFYLCKRSNENKAALSGKAGAFVFVMGDKPRGLC